MQAEAERPFRAAPPEACAGSTYFNFDTGWWEDYDTFAESVAELTARGGRVVIESRLDRDGNSRHVLLQMPSEEDQLRRLQETTKV